MSASPLAVPYSLVLAHDQPRTSTRTESNAHHDVACGMRNTGEAVVVQSSTVSTVGTPELVAQPGPAAQTRLRATQVRHVRTCISGSAGAQMGVENKDRGRASLDCRLTHAGFAMRQMTGATGTGIWPPRAEGMPPWIIVLLTFGCCVGRPRGQAGQSGAFAVTAGLATRPSMDNGPFNDAGQAAGLVAGRLVRRLGVQSGQVLGSMSSLGCSLYHL